MTMILDKPTNPNHAGKEYCISIRQAITDCRTIEQDVRSLLPTLEASIASIKRAQDELKNALKQYDRANDMTNNHKIAKTFAWCLDPEKAERAMQIIETDVYSVIEELNFHNPSIDSVFDLIDRDEDAIELAEFIIEEGHGAHTSMQWTLEDVHKSRAVLRFMYKSRAVLRWNTTQCQSTVDGSKCLEDLNEDDRRWLGQETTICRECADLEGKINWNGK